MNSNEVLAMYENIASLTGQMVNAAGSRHWAGLTKLESQCAAAAGCVETGIPALHGAQRMRKIDLLKQILANDREIRAVTEPWMAQLSNLMPAPRQQ